LVGKLTEDREQGMGINLIAKSGKQIEPLY